MAVESLEGRALLSTWTVNSLDDAGDGTLRWAITQANQNNEADVIDFSVTGTITLQSALPDLSDTTGLTDIAGPGATDLTVSRNNAEGIPGFGIFTVDADAQVNLVGLTITGGLADHGGGIGNAGTLTVINSTITDNSATYGGGIDNEGGVLILVNSQVSGNTSTSTGGGIQSSGTTILVGCSITDNQAQANNHDVDPFKAGDGMGGGLYIDSGSLQLTHSTIQGNSVSGTDSDIFTMGGGYALGGGIYLANATATITDVTISGNSALGGSNNGHGDVGELFPIAPGGSALGGGIYLANGTATITDVTISGNSAVGGHGGSELVFVGPLGPVYAPGGPALGGGIYLADGTASISAATIAGNSVAGGVGGGAVLFSPLPPVPFFGGDGGEADGGGVYLGGTTSSLGLVNGTITGNNAAGGAGGNEFGGVTEGSPPPDAILAGIVTDGNGGASFGGGIAVAAGSSSVTVVNDTIVDNSSSGGLGGGYGGLYSTSEFGFRSYGVPDSPASTYGGGVGIQSGPVTLYNTIVALNSDDIGSFGTVSGSYNLIGTGGSGGLIDGDNGNKVGVADPGLGPLADNGGPTQTIGLLSYSPAIDAGSNDLIPAGFQYDQRGTGFPRIVGSSVDIGAFEVQSLISTVAVGWGSQFATLQTAPDGLRLLPAGRNTDLPWLGIQQVRITLTRAAALTVDDISVTSERNIDYGSITLSGSGTSYTITLDKPIDAADRVTLTIGNELIAGFTRRLDVLPGDVNDDAVVNAQDMVLIRNAFQKIGDPLMIGWADVDGNGVVQMNDYAAARRKLGRRLV